MARRTKMIILFAVSVAVWVGVVCYLYNDYNTPKAGEPNSSGWVAVIGKEMKQDKNGKWVEKSFVEAKAGQLVLLTLVCGGVALFAGLRALKRPVPEEEEYDGNLRL
jgi:hypothetical protein